MKIGFYAGSFDPFTYGHLHIIKKSAKLFDKVIVGIGVNPKKVRCFNQEKMRDAIEKVLIRENINNATVITYDNLSVDVATQNNATYLIRGIRNGMDYQYEENIALVNEEISGLDTIYIRSGYLGYISSSLVMDLINNGKDVSRYLPQEIIDII